MEAYASIRSLLDIPDPARALHIARLLACTTWLMLHRVLCNRGFVFRRRNLSTDTQMSLIIGALSALWTYFAVQNAYTLYTVAVYEVSAAGLEPHSDYTLILSGIAELAFAPLLVQTLFVFWIVSWLDGLRAEGNDKAKPYLWSLTSLRGPFDWKSGMARTYYYAMVLSLILVVGFPSGCAISYGDAFQGLLNLAALLMFLLDGALNNSYLHVPHHYADDRLRIALPTTHHEGMVYVLPSKNVGIDAVWTPKIAAEHTEADNEITVLFSHMCSGQWTPNEPRDRLRRTLAGYQKRVLLSTSEAELLASWIYADKSLDSEEATSLYRIECQRRPGVHLIGRDLIFALCHAEYLVFMAQGRLSATTQAKLGTLRLISHNGGEGGGARKTAGSDIIERLVSRNGGEGGSTRRIYGSDTIERLASRNGGEGGSARRISGSSDTIERLTSRNGVEGGGVRRTTGSSDTVEDLSPTTIGFKPGLEGYRRAVSHVYSIFNLPVDKSALKFPPTTIPPRHSYALNKPYTDINKYAGELWDLSTQHSESTFSALFFFTTVWSVEMGNVNGFHVSPLRCKSREGDLVGQQVAWRQAWYAVVLAQLVATSPALFMVFVAGYLQ